MPQEQPFSIVGSALRAGAGYDFFEIAAPLLLNVDKKAAAGSTISDGTQLTHGVSLVTGADGTKAVLLPAITAPGELVIVVNTNESSALEIFPDAAGVSINTASPGAAFTVAAMGIFIAFALNSTQWYAGEIAVAVA